MESIHSIPFTNKVYVDNNLVIIKVYLFDVKTVDIVFCYVSTVDCSSILLNVKNLLAEIFSFIINLIDLDSSHFKVDSAADYGINTVIIYLVITN